MGEQARKDGDSWNEVAVALLEALGWRHIGDKDMDLPGTDGKEYGIDALMIYENPGKSIPQTVLVESKWYGKGSLTRATLEKWLNTLHKKQNMLKSSGDLLEEFPVLENCSDTNLGVIMVWVHNGDEDFLSDKFQKFLSSIVINTAPRAGMYSRIMVLDNRRIVRLKSMIDILKNKQYNFVYPSEINDNIQLERSNALSIEYMLSNSSSAS